MKKFFKFAVVTLLCVSMAGCSNFSKNNKKDKKSSPTSSSELVEDNDMGKDNDYNYSALCMEYLEYIGTNLPDRNMTSVMSDHSDTIKWITSELKNAGYTDDQIEVKKQNSGFMSTVKNIILHVKGKDSSKQIIVGGHYDGDGIGDNGSGIALMLATAVGLKDVTPKYDVEYVFFDGEELGLLGSNLYANDMSDEDVSRTLYMINIDSIAFGDYCNVYGGVTNLSTGEVEGTEIYELACSKAKYLGMDVCGPDELDGYYAEHGTGPDIKANTIYTSPWTAKNPAPAKMVSDDLIAYAPATIPFSDHVDFYNKGIPYVYFEATNWFAGDDELAYTGYIETYDLTMGDGGMFMNTEYDTLDNLNSLFPGRAKEHFEVYSPLLSSLILNPDGESNEA